jgi:hypothetical protein
MPDLIALDLSPPTGPACLIPSSNTKYKNGRSDMKVIKLLAVIAASTYLYGCAAGAKQENIAYRSYQQATYAQELNQNVSLDNVTGGRATNPA